MSRLLGTSLVALSLALAACGGGSGGTDPGSSAAPTLRLHVTDGPFPFGFVASASVVVADVRVHDATTDQWVSVFQGPREIDLVPLTGGVSELLASATVPPGEYDEVRLIVDGGAVVLTEDAVVEGDSRTFSVENGGLSFPSGAQSGIKVKIDVPVTVATGISADLVLDFDLSKNFVFNGPPDHAPGVKRVLFTPVVRAANRTTSGRIVLDVLSDAATPDDTADDVPLAGASVTATDANGVEAASALADAAGHLELVLPPGTYDLVVEASSHGSATVLGVVVVLGNATTLPPVLLAGTASFLGTVLGDSAATPADASDDVFVEGATVTATPAGGGTPVATTTDAVGAWRLDGLAPGTWDVVVSATGYADATVAAVVPTAAGTTVDVTLAPVP